MKLRLSAAEGCVLFVTDLAKHRFGAVEVRGDMFGVMGVRADGYEVAADIVIADNDNFGGVGPRVSAAKRAGIDFKTDSALYKHVKDFV